MLDNPHLWNLSTEDGKVLVCKGEHEREAACVFQYASRDDLARLFDVGRRHPGHGGWSGRLPIGRGYYFYRPRPGVALSMRTAFTVWQPVFVAPLPGEPEDSPLHVWKVGMQESIPLEEFRHTGGAWMPCRPEGGK